MLTNKHIETTTEPIRLANEVFFAEIKRFLEEGKDVIFAVSGNSMAPFVKHGERVLLKSMDSVSFRTGRIVLAKTDKGVVLHRIVAVDDAVVCLTGDGNLGQYEWAERKDVWGVVLTNVERKLDMQAPHRVLRAWIWYRIRPLRRLMAKCTAN